MKKYNSINLKSFIIMVVVLVATFFVSMGCAYAYFTATARSQTANVNTAIIRVGFSSDTTIQNTSSPFIVSERVYPGSTITVNGAVENTGNYEVWAILELQVSVAGVVVEQSYFTATGTPIERNDGAYTTSATMINDGQNSNFTLTYTLDSSYGNTYMGESITVSVVAHAIQYANIPSGVDATNILSEFVLPSEYQAVEYLTFSGTQYINTLYKPNESTRVYIDFNPSVSNVWVFGSRTSATNSNNFGLFLNSNQFWLQKAGDSAPNGGYANVSSVLGRRKISINETSMSIDGTTALTYSNNLTTSTLDLYLGTMNGNGSVDSRRFRGNIYQFEILEGNRLMLKLIPCYRKADNVAGMYDVVNDVFYSNLGTGTFGVGPEI